MSRDFPGINCISRGFHAIFQGFHAISRGFPPIYTAVCPTLAQTLYTKFAYVFWPTIISACVDFRALTLPLRWQCKSKISLQSKFQPNRTSGYGDIAIFFKIWPKFDPSSGTLWPIPKIFTMYNLLYCVGSVSKFQPPRTKTVAGVWKVMTFLAPILYIYRFKTSRKLPMLLMGKIWRRA